MFSSPLYIFVSSCYHRGRRNTYHHTNLLQLEGVNDKAASNYYLGKKVAYIYKAQKAVSGSKFRVVWGKVMRGHGTNGVVRAKFSTNLSVSLSKYLQYILIPSIVNSLRPNSYPCIAYSPQQSVTA